MSMTANQSKTTTIAEAANSKQFDHFIGGQFVPSISKQTFEDINPATDEVIARVANGGPEDVDAAVTSAHQAFEHGPWPRMSIAERCKVLRKIGDLILENRQTLALAETADTGKPLSESFDGDIL